MPNNKLSDGFESVGAESLGKSEGNIRDFTDYQYRKNKIRKHGDFHRIYSAFWGKMNPEEYSIHNLIASLREVAAGFEQRGEGRKMEADMILKRIEEMENRLSDKLEKMSEKIENLNTKVQDQNVSIARLEERTKHLDHLPTKELMENVVDKKVSQAKTSLVFWIVGTVLVGGGGLILTLMRLFKS
jgi:peptidoglycan hydrolase CwlO-like protein